MNRTLPVRAGELARTYLKIVDGKENHLYKSGHAPFAR